MPRATEKSQHYLQNVKMVSYVLELYSDVSYQAKAATTAPREYIHSHCPGSYPSFIMLIISTMNNLIYSIFTRIIYNTQVF